MAKIIAIDLGAGREAIGVCVIDETRKTVDFPTLSRQTGQHFGQFQAKWGQLKRDINASRPEDDRVNDHGLWAGIQPLDRGQLDALAAVAASSLAAEVAVLAPDFIAVDTTQGFARLSNPRRQAEGVLGTSGKTGEGFGFTEGLLSWPRIVLLGIKVFDALETHGYRRIETRMQAPGEGKLAIEIYPRASTYAFGLFSLTVSAMQQLRPSNGLQWTQAAVNPHRRDAAVGALTVRAWLTGEGILVGHPFMLDDAGIPREGYILIPDPGKMW